MRVRQGLMRLRCRLLWPGGQPVLAATLIRGNGLLFRAAGLSAVEEAFPGDAAAGLACCIPEGDCAYELLVQ